MLWLETTAEAGVARPFAGGDFILGRVGTRRLL
jgi:hypothetical protein